MARSGDLHVTKECSEYKGLAGDFCTITSSNLDEIEAGAKVVYEQAAGEGSLDTDIVLDAGRMPLDVAEVPSDHLLLHLAGDGDAIALCVFENNDQDVRATLAMMRTA